MNPHLSADINMTSVPGHIEIGDTISESYTLKIEIRVLISRN